jgi:hypothetical protein
MKLPNWFVCLGEALMEESKATAQFTLTDEEREALSLDYSRLTADSKYDKVTETLRNLLERTK